MAIDLQFHSAELPKAFFGRKSGRAALGLIQSVVENWAQKTGLGPLCYSDFDDDGLLVVDLVPGCDPLVLMATEEHVSGSVRTSNGGPGYHASVLDLLDYVGSKLSMSWGWTGDRTTSHDPTGYAVHRHCAALEAEMISEFRKRIEDAASRPDAPISMGVPTDIYLDEWIATPRGVRSRDWLNHVLSASEGELRREAQSFYVWWKAGFTDVSCLALLETLLWQEVRWRKPSSEAELIVAGKIDYLRQTLSKRGVPLTDELSDALRDYDQSKTCSVAKLSDGIGFRRRLVRKQLYQNWSVSVPDFLEEAPPQNEEVNFFDERISVTFSSMTALKHDDRETGWPPETASEVFGNGSLKWVHFAAVQNGEFFHQVTLFKREDQLEVEMLLMTFVCVIPEDFTLRDELAKRVMFGWALGEGKDTDAGQLIH